MKIKEINRVRGIHLTPGQREKLLQIFREDGRVAILGICTIRQSDKERVFNDLNGNNFYKKPIHANISKWFANKTNRT